jgi:hypothetical protein
MNNSTKIIQKEGKKKEEEKFNSITEFWYKLFFFRKWPGFSSYTNSLFPVTRI